MTSPEVFPGSSIQRKIVEIVDRADLEYRLEFIYKGCSVRAIESLGCVYWYIKDSEGRYFEFRERPAELNYSAEESARRNIGEYEMKQKIDQLIGYGWITVN